MSEFLTMAWEGKKLNLREEEKVLDDQLMAIGLLEPGMSIEEKRELASALLESTRMAREQSQMEKDEEWELMILSDEDSKDKAGTSKGKVRADKNRISTENIDETQRDKDGSRGKTKIEQHPTVVEDLTEREIKMGLKNRDEQMEPEEWIYKRSQRIGRDARRKDPKKGDCKVAKDVIIIDDERKKELPRTTEKPSCSSEELEKHKKDKGAIPKSSFYGSSNLLETTNPNPFSTEIYGTTAKRCPPRNNNLLRLVEEDMRKKLAEEVNREETCKNKAQKSKVREGRSKEEKEIPNHTKESVLTSEEDCSIKSHGNGKRQKDTKVEDKGSVTKDDRLSIFPKRELQSAKNGDRTRTRKMVSLALSSAGVAKTLGEDESCEKRRREEEISDRSSASLIEDFQSEGEETPNGYVKTPDEKKRRVEKEQLSRKWSDVAAGKKVNLPENEDEMKNSAGKKSNKLMPNKRWRRVKRNFESSFGSGSEVDEWISSDEDGKVEPKLLTKDQIIARLDNSLLKIKNALQKQQSSELQSKNKRVKNHVCRKSKYKVPPGFQEPDSDDDCNLWKICFSDKQAEVGRSENEENKQDTPASANKTMITRSKMRQRNSRSPSLSSKSVSSVEDRGTSSPLRMSPLKEILPGPSTQNNEESQSTSKSSSLKELDVINKVTFPTITVSIGTQTPRDSDSESDHSSSGSNNTVPPSTKSNEVREECKPVWDLFEVEDKKDDVVELEEMASEEESKPDSVNCPICNRAYPMAKIEAHASVCNAEEESSDGEPFTDHRTRRDNLRPQRMASKATGVSSSAVSGENQMEMDIPEEIIGDSSHEEEDDYRPRPARLAPFVPISQQKDSCINYNDQFPEINSNANLQASLAKIRKKLMKAGTKKRVWRRRKKGRSKRMPKK